MVKKWFLAFLVMSFWTSGALAAQKIAVGSRDIHNGKTIANKFVFSGFGCSGKNVSPEVHWSHLPAGTKSLALTVYDPDAPTGSGWWHWVVYNLPPSLKGLPEGAGNKNGKGLPPTPGRLSPILVMPVMADPVLLREMPPTIIFLPSMP